MRKFTMFFVAIVMSIVLVGCGTEKKPNTTDDVNDNPTTDNGVTDDTTVNDDMNDPNNADGTTGTGDTTGINNNEGDTNGDLTHDGERNLDVADDVADKVAELDEVERANVILTNNQAYVAVEMDKGTTRTDSADEDATISKDLETKIANKVREANADVGKVYVSLNPDFVERMNDYRTRIDEGEPIEGMFDEFGEAMRNVFPNAR